VSWIPGVTIAGYVRWNFPDGAWAGDSCGCSDDRCRDGYHHEPNEDCGCLDALLNQYVMHVNGAHQFCVLGCGGKDDAR
jgi:hypothetical protein